MKSAQFNRLAILSYDEGVSPHRSAVRHMLAGKVDIAPHGTGESPKNCIRNMLYTRSDKAVASSIKWQKA